MNAAVATYSGDLLDSAEDVEDEVDENNNGFLINLKPVFEACDYNGDGYVKVQDLIDLGQQYTNTTKDDVSFNFLDPPTLGAMSHVICHWCVSWSVSLKFSANSANDLYIFCTKLNTLLIIRSV